jgi:hypothetical protein
MRGNFSKIAAAAALCGAALTISAQDMTGKESKTAQGGPVPAVMKTDDQTVSGNGPTPPPMMMRKAGGKNTAAPAPVIMNQGPLQRGEGPNPPPMMMKADSQGGAAPAPAGIAPAQETGNLSGAAAPPMPVPADKQKSLSGSMPMPAAAGSGSGPVPSLVRGSQNIDTKNMPEPPMGRAKKASGSKTVTE